MMTTKRMLAAPTDLDFSDFTQEIESPLDPLAYREEPTLSKIDFDELELLLDF